MKTLDLQQGSEAWLADRRGHCNASEASIIMGCHPDCSRSELIRLKARGAEQEFSDWVRQHVLDHGHAVEAAARHIVERDTFGEELFAVCGESDDGKLRVSFDGLPMLDPRSWECKQYAAAKYAAVEGGTVPKADLWQVVQQSYTNDKNPVIYTVSDGTPERTASVEYQPSEDEYQRLLLAWDQFEHDLAEYDASHDVPPKPEGASPDTLPALHVEATGKVIASNLDAYRDHAMAVLGSINRDLQTDQDFSDAEATIKWAKAVEAKLSAAKDNVLGQMATVDEVCRTIDDLSAETRRVRLELDKLVKTEKDHRKADIVQHHADQVRAHYAGINASMGQHAVSAPQSLALDIGSAIKGLKTVSSITDAADTCAANLKIAGSQQADRVRAAVAVLDEFADHASLFADRVQLCREKSPEDLRNLAKTRVAEYEEHERQRIEADRQQIRAEEQAKAEREAEAKTERLDPDPNTAPGPRSPTPQEVAATGAVEKATRPDTRLIKLGDIQKVIAPLSITAAGLEKFGITPQQSGRSKLYTVDSACAAIACMLEQLEWAPQELRKSSKQAA